MSEDLFPCIEIGGKWVIDRQQVRVLLVEDNASLRNVAKLYLTLLLNYCPQNILECRDGAEGLVLLDQLGSQKPHIILTDYLTPVMDGLTFFSQLRERYPEYYRQVVKAVWTGVSVPEEREELTRQAPELQLILLFKPLAINDLMVDVEHQLLHLFTSEYPSSS